MNLKPRRAVIVGAGIGGLAAAYRLEKLAAERSVPIQIDLFDSATEVGGVIRTLEQDGFILEGGPDCFISEKPAALDLAKELGLAEELIGTSPDHRQSFILKSNRLIPVPEGLYLMAPSSFWPFVRSPLVSWPGKIRMGMDLFIPRSDATKDESLESFVLRRLGREALTRIAQPMLAGIYTADPANLSLKATMPRFLEMEQKYGSIIRGLRTRKKALPSNGKAQAASGPRYGLFVSFKKGLQTLPLKIRASLRHTTFHLPSQIVRVSKNGAQWQVEDSKQRVFEADWLFLASQASMSAKLLADSAPGVTSLLGTIQHASTATINFAFRRDQIAHPLNGMGFVVPNVEKRSVVGVSFSSRKFAERAPADRVLLRAFVGGGMHEQVLSRDDRDLTRYVLSDLRELLGITGDPLFTLLHRWQKSMPQYSVGHLELIDRIESQLQKEQGLYVIGNSFRGIGVPDVAQRASDLAKAAFAS